MIFLVFHSFPIYLVLPDSGDFKVLSEEFLKGFSFALRDEVDFNVIDEDPDTNIDFREIFENVISKKPKIIIGPILSKNQRISAEISMHNKVIQIIPITYDIFLGTYGNYVYPFNFKNYLGIRKFIETLRERGDTNFVLFYENTINGLSMKKFLDGQISIPTVVVDNKKITTQWIAEIIKDIKNYDVILFSDAGISSINTYLNLRKMGYKKDVYVFDSWLSSEVFPTIIGMTENLYIITLSKITYTSYLLKLDRKYKFIEAYKNFYNSEPTTASLIGYDTGMLVKEALKSDDIKEFLLRYGILNGISGNYLISKNLSYIKVLKLTPKGLEEVK